MDVFPFSLCSFGMRLSVLYPSQQRLQASHYALSLDLQVVHLMLCPRFIIADIRFLRYRLEQFCGHSLHNLEYRSRCLADILQPFFRFPRSVLYRLKRYFIIKAVLNLVLVVFSVRQLRLIIVLHFTDKIKHVLGFFFCCAMPLMDYSVS